jgi:hypothetical protein
LPRHEHFEELAAVRARGELTPSQEEELVLHLADCDPCRQVQEEFEELHEPLGTALDPSIDAIIESRRDKVKAAMFHSIRAHEEQTSSHAPVESPLPIPSVRSDALRPIFFSLATAAAVVLTFSLGIAYERRTVARSSEQEPAQPVAVGRTNPLAAATPSESRPDDPPYAELLTDLRTEKQRSAKLTAQVSGKDTALADAQASRLTVQQQLDSQADELRRTQAQLTAKSDQLNQMQAAKASDATSLVALQYQVADLTQKLNDQTQSLDRERQLLANGRDIRDIIGARNLHILDVYDTDSQGNTRKSFARAFYTEGKSLVFYAYDLPTRGTDEGKFVYTAWGESNGNKNRVQKLGVLLNDDKGQKRWALNFSDPKVLAEIDSVFVTLERVDMDSEQPKGKRMLTAYLDSQVNHP